MIVKVTQEHIDKSNEVGCCFCPVELALLDVFKTKHVYTIYTKIYVGMFPDDTLVFERETPPEVSDWMFQYDTKGDVKPFEFELSLEGVKL